MTPHRPVLWSHKAYRNLVTTLLFSAIVLGCGSGAQETATEGTVSTIDWYSINDAGLLSIEKLGGDSLSFSLIVGTGESCVGEASGIASLQADGTWRYGNEHCALDLEINADAVIVREIGEHCDHGANCSFSGTYPKAISEKVTPANGNAMSWMGQTIGEFACVLQQRFGYTDEKYKCGVEDQTQYDPSEPSWYEGPAFPDAIVSSFHPGVKGVSVQFEHGQLYMLRVTLNEKMILQDVQRIFSLPNSFANYGSGDSNVMSLTFDDYNPEEALHLRLRPVFVTSFTLTAFEHQGSGDADYGEVAPEVGADAYYEYREDGNSFVLVDEGGPGPYEFTCTGFASVKTSSELASQGSSSYKTSNLTDMVESTAWAEGKGGLGVGEWVEFTLTGEYRKYYDDKDFLAKALRGEFVIQTGYAKSPAVWKRNSRPVRLQCYLNGQALSVINLLDTPDFQKFSIFTTATGSVDLKEGDAIRFVILEVAKGTDEDACISEFHIMGNCG